MTSRIRYLKPDFFVDEDIARLPPLIRLFFQGLWCHADREGRLEDRPERLKVEIAPYEKDFDVDAALNILSKPKRPGGRPFLQRYEIKGERFIQILTFTKHQRAHHTERASVIPSPPEDIPLTVKEPLKVGSIPGRNGDGDGELRIGRDAPIAKSNIDEKFEEFWIAYPREGRHAKKESRTKFGTIFKRGEMPDFVKGFHGYLDFLKDKRVKENFDQRPMYAKTFLNDRWKEYVGFEYKAAL